MSSSSPERDVLKQPGPQKKRAERRTGLLIVVALAIIVGLALALGVGLGIGLKRHHNNASSTSSPSNGDSGSSQTVESWRQATENYMLDMTSWDLNAPPTTRSYNFTVSEITIAPDGNEHPPRL